MLRVERLERTGVGAGAETASRLAFAPPAAARAFSLIELLVVMLMVTVLTGLLLPTLSVVRENARRVYCTSSMHQIGMAIVMYSDQSGDRLPYSAYGDPGSHDFNPQDMMALHVKGTPEDWDGLGLLYRHQYCSAAQCFYCPSHHGQHFFEEIQDEFTFPTGRQFFGNYHYAGHVVWDDRAHRAGTPPVHKWRTLLDGHRVVLVTDGLRTAIDFNHDHGMNVLRGDLSVSWQEDPGRSVFDRLPVDPGLPPTASSSLFADLWEVIGEPASAQPVDGS